MTGAHGTLRMRFAAMAAAVCLAFAGGVAPARAQLSDSEKQMGAQAHPQILEQYGGEYENAAVERYVHDTAMRIIAVSGMEADEYHVTVLNSPIVNAFALPGGYVYVTRGLVALANSEAELAGVLAHEISHVTKGHHSQRMNATFGAVGVSLLGALADAIFDTGIFSDVAGIGVPAFLGHYSREQEYEADAGGVELLEKAGYDPYAEARFLDTLNAQSALHAELKGARYDPNRVDWLASHPATGQRVREANALAEKAGAVPGQGRVGVSEHFAAIDGMLYGDDPEQGYVRGRTFTHPELGFAFEVPEGYLMTNTSEAVFAEAANGSKVRFDMAGRGDAVSMADYVSRIWGKGANIYGIRKFEVNGRPAATGTTRAEGGDVRLIAIAGRDDEVYRFLASTPNLTQQVDDDLRDMAYSFRLLNKNEAAEIEPLTIRVHKVRRGETVAALAGRTAFADAAEQRFRVLNGLEAGEEVSPGDLVKIVE